jgi:hypothetical protein
MELPTRNFYSRPNIYINEWIYVIKKSDTSDPLNSDN